MNDHGRLAFIPRLAGTAVITALLTALATPAFASSPTTPTPSPFSAAALAKAVKSTPAPLAATPATPAKTPAKARQASGSFFKSKVGVLVIAVFAAGTGYAIYSAKEDRILGLNR